MLSSDLFLAKTLSAVSEEMDLCMRPFVLGR